MDRIMLLRKNDIDELESLLAAVDRLLKGPGRYFDPAILPDPGSPEDFCTRYDLLRGQVRADLDESARSKIPSRRFEVQHGPTLPIQGCLLREDMVSMRQDIEVCIEAVRSASMG